MTQLAIETLLKQKIGLEASSIGGTVARAIERRCAACGLRDRAAYWNHLQTSPQELEALIESVVVPETWFFRDKEPFVYLQQYVTTERLKATMPKVLRVLSVPCSTGEEPYSIAMTLFEAGLSAAQFAIDAMDISQQALLKAKQAIYSKRSFRGGDGLETKKRYFQEVTNGYEVRSFVRDTIAFKQANILDPGLLAPSRYHVIFCRNLLIYLDRNARDRALQALDRALAPAGLLFVGAAETMQISTQNYTAVPHASAFAYCKASRPAATASAPVAPKTSLALNKPFLALPERRQQSATSDLDRAKECANRGQLLEAAQYCEAYVDRHRTDANAYLLLGEIYQGLDRLDRAEQAYQKAIYLNPHSFEALVHLSLLKEQKGDRFGSDLLKRRVQRLVAMQANSLNRTASDEK